MKKVAIALLGVLAAVSSCSFSVNFGSGKSIVCKGPVVDTEMTPGDFNAIVVNGSADLKFAPYATCGVVVTTHEDALQYLDIHVEDGVLYIETKDKVQLKTRTLDVYVGAPTLESVVVNGASDASIVSIDQDADLTICVNGAGDVDMENVRVPKLVFTVNGAADLDASGLDVEEISVNVNGAGDVDLSGRAGHATLSVSGAGDIDARELDCPSIDKSKAGVASIRTR